MPEKSNKPVNLLASMLCSIIMISGSLQAHAEFGQISIGGLEIRPDKPFDPVRIEPVKIPGIGAITPPVPGLIPVPQRVHLDGNGEIAKALNQLDNAAHAPAAAAQNAMDATFKGLKHLGNEVGMLWPRFVQSLKDRVSAFIDRVIDMAKVYVVWAIVTFFGVMVLAAMLGAFFVKLFSRNERALPKAGRNR
jgi:hypothetical protein